MSDNEQAGSRINLDIGASAKINLDLKAEVPTRSVGGLVDALTDLIRPWSERRGLKADQIRLHREDVALEIAKRARRRMAIESAEPAAIPLKILIPLLEKGSQEEINDDYMIDMWANLLASSATDTNISPRFIGIISELNGRQARLLQSIARRKDMSDATQGSFEVQRNFVENNITSMLRKRKQWTVEEFGEELMLPFSRNGTLLVAMIIHSPAQEKDPSSWEWHDPLPSGPPVTTESDLEILASLGLLERIDIHRETKRGEVDFVSLHYYRMTYLADDFLVAVRTE